MKGKLDIKHRPTMLHSTEHVIRGFTDDELVMLAGMSSQEALDWILEELDERNDGIGTVWHNGYGIHCFQIRMSDGTVVVVTGASCC